MTEASPSELMTIVDSRLLGDRIVSFFGIGIPSKAATMARITRPPNLILIYESGTIGAPSETFPLSIGDGELATTADTVISTMEIFSHWLQGGRVIVVFLGAAQVDRFANLNSTVIGDYAAPKVLLPGAGGTPEIASLAAETFVIIKHDNSRLVEKVDFVISSGFLDGGDSRQQKGICDSVPSVIITDLFCFRPDAETKELIVNQLHPGVTRDDVCDTTGWAVTFADDLFEAQSPTETELATLRELELPAETVQNGGGE
ncbi:MAG: CoA-transferase [Planctomycetota bacterium]|nr:CoA-transferase [Planctomycetota bacterium]